MYYNMRMEKLINYISCIEDTRYGFNLKHKLIDIIIITILAIMNGVTTWDGIALFGRMREKWLREFLELPNGIPSHDTFNRVFSLIDPIKLEDCLQRWVREVFQMSPKGVISIDGKSVKGSASPGSHKYVHMISAWSHEADLVLGQLKVDEKTNEIKAIPQLLDNLDIEGSIITIDAMGCQKDIVNKILEKKGDYIIALKGNQGKLKDEAIDTTKLTPASAYSSEIDCGHGRIEKRTVRVYRDIHTITGLWVGLSSVIRIDSTRYDKKKETEHTEVRYYITSLKRVSAAKIGEYIRQHWDVENKLHWCLDVSFGEDHSQKRAENAAENFSRAIRFVINSFRRYKKLINEKLSVKNMQFACAMDVEYMKKIFAAVFSV